ncbi:MAG TPA: hypothetical protein VF650_02725 [Allosphingosinicella sp.]
MGRNAKLHPIQERLPLLRELTMGFETMIVDFQLYPLLDPLHALDAEPQVVSNVSSCYESFVVIHLIAWLRSRPATASGSRPNEALPARLQLSARASILKHRLASTSRLA